MNKQANHVDKEQKKNNRLVVSSVISRRSRSGGAFTFVDNRPEAIVQRKRQDLMNNNSTPNGLPVDLKSGMESLSGHSLDDVNVHYNSSKPAQLNAHAYAQGPDIYLASGQEKHLPHEAWHVVQQKQGRVKPTLQMQGVHVNDDQNLEKEADVMGARALQLKGGFRNTNHTLSAAHGSTGTVQGMLVAQLATRLSSPVQFNGGAEALRLLVLRWGPPGGTQVQVIQTDFVGGTYQVRFTRNNGAISLQQANQWVQRALAHAPQDDSSSSESESESSSSESE